MPNILTHYKFCRDRIKDNDVSKIALLGSQGPDPFFFYVASFKGKAKQNSKIGSLLHTINPYIMYEYFIDYALKRSKREKEILFSFIKGMMYHYCVDRECHPYVFYLSGFKTEGEKKKIRFHLSHSAIETNIDVLLKEKFNFDIKPLDAIEAPVEQIKLVSVMIYSFVKNVLKNDIINPSSYFNAVMGTYRMEKILYSKKGIKKKLYSIFLRRTSINTLSMPLKVKNNDKLDYLNEKKNTWKEPATGKERNESFLELLNISHKLGDEVDDILSLASNEKEYKNRLDKFIDNINHHGNKFDETKKYYSLIWNRLSK